MEMMINENLSVHEAEFVIKELNYDLRFQYLRTRQENLDQQLKLINEKNTKFDSTEIIYSNY